MCGMASLMGSSDTPCSWLTCPTPASPYCSLMFFPTLRVVFLGPSLAWTYFAIMAGHTEADKLQLGTN